MQDLRPLRPDERRKSGPQPPSMLAPLKLPIIIPCYVSAGGIPILRRCSPSPPESLILAAAFPARARRISRAISLP